MAQKEIAARYRARHPERAKACVSKWRNEMRTKVAEYKAERGCEDCGTTDVRVLDLHHKNEGEKIMAVSQMLNRRSWLSVKAEMDKCRVLCANCHRIEHAENHERDSNIVAQINAAGFYRAA